MKNIIFSIYLVKQSFVQRNGTETYSSHDICIVFDEHLLYSPKSPVTNVCRHLANDIGSQSENSRFDTLSKYHGIVYIRTDNSW